MDTVILRRTYWRLLRAIGLERVSWDSQFELGVWLRRQISPYTVHEVADLCDGGRLIEFGCGDGSLPLSLPLGSFSQYIGYDISAAAVRLAAESARKAGLINCQFQQCDMAKWEGAREASLIVAEECLYYLTQAEAETFLRRCRASILAGGRMLVIVHCATKHAATLDTCRRIFSVEKEFVAGGRTYIVLS